MGDKMYMIKNKKELLESMGEISQCAELLYQQKIPEAMKQFERVMATMQEIVESFFSYRAKSADFSFDEDKMKKIFEEIVSAMEERDYTLLADIIQYEFVEYVQELSDELQ